MSRAHRPAATIALIATAVLALAAGYRSVQAQGGAPPEPPDPFLLVAGPSGSVGFGRVETTAAAPVTRILTLQNGGTVMLAVTSLFVQGAHASDFSVVDSTCASVAPTGFCAITIGFNPAANGDRTGRLVITDNAGGTPHLIPLMGFGVDPSLPQPGVGPIDPRIGFPISYSDGFTSLELCLGNQLSTIDSLTPMCLSPVPDPDAPPSLTDDGRPVNFPEEAFWWSADATIDIGDVRGLLVLAQEAAFLNEVPAVGDQMAFGRVRIRLRGLNNAIPANTWFRFTHPFGIEEHEALPAQDGDPAGDIFVTNDIGCFSAPCDFTQTFGSRITRFLRCVEPAPPAGYVGDPAVTCTVEGSPTDYNGFRIQQITGPGGTPVAGGISGETNQFTVTGKIAADLGSPPPTSILVPDLVNLTQGAATTAIAAAGLVVGVISNGNSATVPAGNVISQAPLAGTSVAPGSAVALAISLGGASPTVIAAVTSNGRGNRSVQLSTTGPARLVAFVSADGPETTGSQRATVSGGGLTWTLVARANAQWGDTEIWTANAPAALTGASITSTLLQHRSTSDYIQLLRVVAFTGVSAIGASGVASGQTTATASVGLVTQAAGSVVYAVGEDWSNPLTRSFPAGQVQDVQFLGTDGDTFWVQRSSAPIAAAGPVTFSAATVVQPAPGDRWNFAIVELKP